jgi:hypothetical protein
VRFQRLSNVLSVLQEALKKRPYLDDVTIDLRKLCLSPYDDILDTVSLTFGRHPVERRCGRLHNLQTIVNSVNMCMAGLITYGTKLPVITPGNESKDPVCQGESVS